MQTSHHNEIVLDVGNWMLFRTWNSMPVKTCETPREKAKAKVPIRQKGVKGWVWGTTTTTTTVFCPGASQALGSTTIYVTYVYIIMYLYHDSLYAHHARCRSVTFPVQQSPRCNTVAVAYTALKSSSPFPAARAASRRWRQKCSTDEVVV